MTPKKESESTNYIGEVTFGQETIHFGANKPELILAQLHDALLQISQVSDPNAEVQIHIEQKDSDKTVDDLAKNMQNRMGKRSRQDSVSDFRNSQEARRNENGIVLFKRTLESHRVLVTASNRLRFLHILHSSNREEKTPPVSTEVIEFVTSLTGESPERIAEIVQKYEQLPINPEIDDPAVRRLCAALKESGIQSYESCEGHGKKLPAIWFRCKRKQLPLLKSAIQGLREQWEITNFNSTFHRNLLELSPVDVFGESSNLADRYPRAIQDLDTLGLKLLLQKEKN